MKRQLTISFEAGPAAGKTTMAAAIAQILRKHGIEVEIQDHDDDWVRASNMTEEHVAKRLQGLRETGLKVTINTLRTCRAASR